MISFALPAPTPDAQRAALERQLRDAVNKCDEKLRYWRSAAREPGRLVEAQFQIESLEMQLTHLKTKLAKLRGGAYDR